MKNTIIVAIAWILAFALFSCSDEMASTSTNTEPPNILFIIADDLGKDAINGYQEGDIKPNTPNIDEIRTNGLMFNNFWVNPTCTPTRASIITGKYAYRTGVKGVGDVLDQSEISLQQYISDQTDSQYASAIVGKWHLSGTTSSTNPESFGIDYYAGLIRGAVDNYYQWQLSEDGVSSLQNTYTTEVFTDLSIEWVNQQSQPWFLWLAYNAPHTPFHVPPADMHSQGTLDDYITGQDPIPYYMAAIEAMDYQIGRLLDNIPNDELDNTVIIFIGDNGSPGQVAQMPFTSATVKNSLYQGGINVPMFISGMGVTRVGLDDHLVSGTDLFATISQIAGVDNNQYQDSKSFYSLLTSDGGDTRKYQYSELKDGIKDLWTISNGRHKLIVAIDGTEELYNLEDDPYEQLNLLLSSLNTEDSIAKMDLESELLNIRN